MHQHTSFNPLKLVWILKADESDDEKANEEIERTKDGESC